MENKRIELSDEECRFLMGCMAISNGEGSYLLDRRYERFVSPLVEEERIDLLRKLGATKEDIKEYKMYG